MFKKLMRERCDWNRARKERGRAKGRFFRGPAVVQARESAEDRPVSCTLGAPGRQRAMRSKHIGNSTQSLERALREVTRELGWDGVAGRGQLRQGQEGSEAGPSGQRAAGGGSTNASWPT